MASLAHVRSILTAFVRLLLSLAAWNILDASAQGETLKYVGKMSFARTVPEGSSVDFSCELNDPSVAVTLWQMLRSGQMYTPRKNLVHYGQLFTLHRVSNNMQGMYICRVRKRRFSQNIGMIYLKPSPKDPPKPTVDAKQKVLLVSGDVRLTCQATGTRISNVQWYKRARPLSMQQQVVTKGLNLNGETWINTLMLKNVRIHQAGWYECRVFETNEAFGFWSTHVKLNVIAKTECPELDGTFADPQRTTGYLVCSGGVSTRMNCSKGLVWRDDKKACDKPAPVIKWETTHHSLRLIRKTVGDSVILNCRMSDPNVRVKLKQKVAFGVIRERFTDGCRVSRDGQTFVIHAVNFTDVGIYYCEAAHLKIRRKEEAYLKVQPAPSSAIYQGYRNLFVSVGSSLDLNCGAPNIFQPFIFLEIIRMDGITQLIPDGHRVTLTGRVVTINGADRSMRGRVVCKVISSCNQAQEDVDLGNLLPVPLKGTPPMLERSQQLSVVNKGESLNITCSVSGGEEHSISWFKNKEPVSVNLVFSSAFRSVLTLNNISKSDAGDYECRIMDFGDGYWQKTTTVMVKDSSTAFHTTTPSTTSPSVPPKQVVPSVIEIVPYQAVDVVCRMFQADLEINLWQESTPGSFIQRTADGVAITRQGNIFTITQARQNDKGTYYCQAANSKKILAAVLTFPDDKPPKIFNFTTKAAVNASQNVKLFCGTEGEPPFANVQWFKNGVSVGRCKGELQQNKTCVLDQHHRKYSISWRGSGAELMIKNVFHPFDTGDFTCVAVNTIGMDNKTVHLDIYEKPVLNKKNDTDFRVLSFRDATMIQSTALRGHPIPHFKWFQQGIEICASGCKPDVKRWRRVPRHVIDPSEQVPSRISSLYLPPGKKGYFFRCIAENSLGHDDVVFSVHRIDMATVLPEIIPSPPFQRVDEGSRLTILCQASTGDFLHLAWQRRSRPQELPTILTRNKHNITCTFTIEHAQMEDAGDYVCYGYGWTANDTKISVITVTVTEFVLPVVSLSNQTIQEEKTNSTILKCLISSGYPAPNITWYKDGKRLSLHALRSSDHCRINGFHYMEKHGPPFAKDLVICKPSHAKNTGVYKCEAKNNKGIDSSAAFLNVLAQPKIFNVVDHKLPKELGEKVNVSCKATGNPIPSVNWVKKTASDGRHVPVTHVDLKNHTLRINSLLEEHYGDYMCLAENKFGNDTVVLSLVKPGLVGAAKDKQTSNASLIVAIVVSVALFLVLLLIAAIFYRRRQLYGGFYICTTPPLPDMIPRLDSSIPLIEQVNKLPYDKRWEFPREQLHFEKVLGSGAFGAVYLAEAEGNIISDNTSTKTSRHRLSTVRDSRRGSTMSQGPIKVAVKTLKERAEESEHKDLISELKILIHIGSHKNIVNLLAACTKGRYSDICVIIEYCPHGNMLQFLRKKREMYNPIWLPPTEDPDKQFSMTDVVSAAFQVARAMEFLASRKCVHRDLAARNVLVGENYVVKVADFGLARDVYKDDTYIKVSPGLVPVKWMAIESLTDRVYSEQSDVWSFGVFAWELFTLGGNPYPNLPPTEIYRYIVEGNRMERPVDCPEEMYAMMRDCWMERPVDRPNFTALVQRLDHVIESTIAAMGREGYLELGDDCVMPCEETDDDGYLRPREIVPPDYKTALLNMNSGSGRDLQGSNKSLTNEPKSKGLIHERYTELGFKPPNNASDITETVL